MATRNRLRVGEYIGSETRSASGFSLPLDYVTNTGAILAVKGSGKSNAAVVMAEQMYDRGLPWVAIDPKGDWWGIRADGIRKGLPVVVLGGLNGVLPLLPTAGVVVADLIVANRLTVVLDTSEFTKADQTKFLTDFVERLRRTNTEPLHVFCEEADEYIPQRVGPDETKCVRAFELMVKRGRTRGLGCTMVTQRSASLNKNVLTQIETLFLLRTPSPQDRKAIEGWLEFHDAAKDVLHRLPKLKAGEAFVISPAYLDTVAEIKFTQRRTYDSGATPEIGTTRAPVKLADIDLGAVEEAMAATVEQVKANDPKHLKAEVARLRRALDESYEALRVAEQRQPEAERIEIPVVGPWAERIEEILLDVKETAVTAVADIRAEMEEMYGKYPPVDFFPQGQLGMSYNPGKITPYDPPKPSSPLHKASRPVSVPSKTPTPGAPTKTLKGPERKILTALAQHGSKDKKTLAILTGYSHGGGGFNNPLGALRSQGYATKGNPIEITQEGVDALGDFEPLPTGRDLLEWWMPQLTGPERTILDALVRLDQAGDPATKERLAEAAGYSPGGGGFNNPIGHLRTLGILSRGWPITLNEEML